MKPLAYIASAVVIVLGALVIHSFFHDDTRR